MNPVAVVADSADRDPFIDWGAGDCDVRGFVLLAGSFGLAPFAIESHGRQKCRYSHDRAKARERLHAQPR